jgi:hypothetical protein
MSSGICPICHNENHCHMVEGKDPATCWCTTVHFPEGLLYLVPENRRNKECICKECLEKYIKHGAESEFSTLG